MSTSSSSSSDSTGIDINNVLYIHPSDSINYALSTQKLNGDNYAQWRRSVEISLTAKNKLDFVTGKSIRHSENSTELLQWDRCNNLVMSWLLHSIEPHISGSVLYCKTAAEIWKDLADRYAISNAPRMYQVQKELALISQGSNSVAVFFTQHKTLWDEFLSMIDLPVCSCGTGHAFAKFLQDQQVYQFLMGLNEDYKTIRGNILMMQPFPSLNQAYRLILQEEKQRECNQTSSINSESAAFVSPSKNGSYSSGYSPYQKNQCNPSNFSSKNGSVSIDNSSGY